MNDVSSETYTLYIKMIIHANTFLLTISFISSWLTGNYGCSHWESTFKCAVRPGPVSDVQVLNIAPRTANLTWIAPEIPPKVIHRRLVHIIDYTDQWGEVCALRHNISLLLTRLKTLNHPPHFPILKKNDQLLIHHQLLHCDFTKIKRLAPLYSGLEWLPTFYTHKCQQPSNFKRILLPRKTSMQK